MSFFHWYPRASHFDCIVKLFLSDCHTLVTSGMQLTICCKINTNSLLIVLPQWTILCSIFISMTYCVIYQHPSTFLCPCNYVYLHVMHMQRQPTSISCSFLSPLYYVDRLWRLLQILVSDVVFTSHTRTLWYPFTKKLGCSIEVRSCSLCDI